MIMIYNRGPQLSENVQKNLFTSYFTTKGENGTGLGLPISKDILEKSMGGSISLNNADGGVACVIVLPLSCGAELGDTEEADDGKHGIS